MDNKSYNVSQYVLKRLHDLGSQQLFGVGGDVVLGFMEQIAHSPVEQINCCNELNAAYAADGYARIHGLGTVVTTFNVGSLSALNAIGGAFVENVPVVLISGAPERRHALAGIRLHHTLSPDYSVAGEMFRKITVACEYLDDPSKAPQQIDSALAKCLFYKKPIYLELPADMVLQPCPAPEKFPYLEKTSSPETLIEAANEICSLLTAAQRPVILLGWEIIRHGLQEKVKAFIEKSGYPFCVFPTAKTALSEDHSHFSGVYQGSWSHENVKTLVETSDCILMLGAFFIDTDTGGFTAKLDENSLIQANFLQAKVKHHEYHDILLSDLLDVLIKNVPSKKLPAGFMPAVETQREKSPYVSEPNAKMTVHRFFKRMASFLRPDDIVVADVGECLYSTSYLLLPRNVTYIAQAFYNSIGYSVGASLGASVLQKRRTLLFVGDGSLQMAAQEVSTMINYGCKPIIFLLNNHGYGIERAIHDGRYNDVSAWHYYLLPQAFSGKPGLLVQTEGELEEALRIAENTDTLTFIEIRVDKFDFGEILRKAGAAMAESSKQSFPE